MAGNGDVPAADATTRFTGRVSAYLRGRPDYPAACVDRLVEGLGSGVAVDVGAGTGVLSRQLRERGWSVVAVEPNEAMRSMAGVDAGTTWIARTGEDTGLACGSAQLVTCAQAFHWLSTTKAVEEFARIARSRARIGVIWNVADDRDLATDGYRSVTTAHAVEPASSPRDDDPIDRACASFDEHGEFEGVRVERWSHAQRLDVEGLLARAASSSYLPNEGAAWEALERDLRGLFDRFTGGGEFVLRYVTVGVLAERR